ncbi:hypothetical protein, partial [uncultured Limosilactobacillus sp.]|uniref:hypothetical protein n=1 Tax=uncultured Limosilactobacillus sp. TaxID=2837629 RepID=UPI0025993A16
HCNIRKSGWEKTLFSRQPLFWLTLNHGYKLLANFNWHLDELFTMVGNALALRLTTVKALSEI